MQVFVSACVGRRTSGRWPFLPVGRGECRGRVGVSKNVQGQRRLWPREKSLLIRSPISPSAVSIFPTTPSLPHSLSLFVTSILPCMFNLSQHSLSGQPTDRVNNVNTHLPSVTGLTTWVWDWSRAAQQVCTTKVGTAHWERIAFVCRAPVMRVNPSYLIASQGYLSHSLDSFRLISTCRHGVAAQWLWSSDALSAQLNCLFSFAVKSRKALCAIFYHLQLLWFKICILSEKMSLQVASARVVRKKKNPAGKISLCCSHNWGSF